MTAPGSARAPSRSNGAAVETTAAGLALGVTLWALLDALGLRAISGLAMGPSLAIVAGASAIAWLIGWRQPVLYVLALVLVVAGLVALTPLMAEPVHRWIRRDPLPSHRLDAIVVLHGGTTADGLLAPASADRLLAGLHLVRDGKADTVIVTRPFGRFGSRLVVSDRDQIALASLVPGVRLVMVGTGVHDTHDEAASVAGFARPRGIRRIAVVTSPLHTRRSCATFEKLGFEVTCVPADDRQESVQALANAHDRTAAFGEWLYERLGWLKYRYEGWV